MPSDAFLRIHSLRKQHVTEDDSHLPCEETEAQKGESRKYQQEKQGMLTWGERDLGPRGLGTAFEACLHLKSIVVILGSTPVLSKGSQ